MVRRAREIERQVGHPGKKWDDLKDRIQADAIERFSDIRADWLDLMWTLDAYRRESVPPEDMGNPDITPDSRITAITKFKGNWFATAIELLLENQTTQRIAPRYRIRGFSQVHQIDVAWPARNTDPLICVETKVSGGPPYGSHGPRLAMSDCSNRRRELKFSSTDLKLHRRGSETRIEHWDEWRAGQNPKVYLLRAARLAPSEAIDELVDDARSLVDSYLDGVGLFAWQEALAGKSYEVVDVPPTARVHELDDVLYRIATEIRRKTGPNNEPPPPFADE